MRRLLLFTTALVATALPASAKMPPFEMEVEPRGDTVHVEVRISGDEALIDSFDPPDLNGLVAVFPANQVDDEGRPLLALKTGTNVPLSRAELGIYEGNVQLEPGRWAVVPFPQTVGALRVEDAYPETIMIEIEDEGGIMWALAAVGAAIAIAWGLRAVVRVQPA